MGHASRMACALMACALMACALMACAPRRTIIASSDDAPNDQWSRGVWLYGQHCAGCHGEHGEGDEDAPALVGDVALPGAGSSGAGSSGAASSGAASSGAASSDAASSESARRRSFHTAADVYAYAREHMPPMSPGALPEDQYWAIVRYVLDMGQRDVGQLDAASAATIKLR
jgi:mono/diheme cytochrome c family protein